MNARTCAGSKCFRASKSTHPSRQERAAQFRARARQPCAQRKSEHSETTCQQWFRTRAAVPHTRNGPARVAEPCTRSDSARNKTARTAISPAQRFRAHSGIARAAQFWHSAFPYAPISAQSSCFAIQRFDSHVACTTWFKRVYLTMLDN